MSFIHLIVSTYISNMLLFATTNIKILIGGIDTIFNVCWVKFFFFVLLLFFYLYIETVLLHSILLHFLLLFSYTILSNYYIPTHCVIVHKWYKKNLTLKIHTILLALNSYLYYVCFIFIHQSEIIFSYFQNFFSFTSEIIFIICF